MRLGDIVFASHINASLGPSTRASYSAPKGELFVFVLVGTMEKKDGANFDAVAALRSLGWQQPVAERKP